MSGGEVSTLGLDIAEHVFHAQGRGVFSKRLTRTKVLIFFAIRRLPRSE
jgi:hypothetical protein